METSGLNLLVPEKPDTERDSLAAAFSRRGGAVHRIGRFWDPPAFNPATVRVYGPDSFCLVLQQKLGFALCSPDDDLLLRIPTGYLQRKISPQPLAAVPALIFPAFIKPVIPKQFRGAVYQSASALKEECKGLPPETRVMVSETVRFTAEVRCFVLNGSVLDAAVYEGAAKISDATAFANEVAQSIALPRTIVVDVGFISTRGWGVIEFNPSWGAGLNGCDPERVLPAIVTASSPSD